MNEINYQKECERIINEHSGKNEAPTLLLHACCAPCSSYCIKYLSDYFKITVLFYNPNIYPKEEFDKRAKEEERFISEFSARYPVKLQLTEYDDKEFYECVKGLEDYPEGTDRCKRCFELRLEKTAQEAKRQGFDYFTTTLTLSPLKNSKLLNEIGRQMGEKYGIKHLPSDFKKRGGYQQSIKLSGEYELYRQNYCGCVFSRRRDYVGKGRREE